MLFFKKKFEKLVDEKKAIKNFAEVRTQMEKGDFKAMVIAAVLVYLPVILIIVGIMFFFAWLLSR